MSSDSIGIWIENDGPNVVRTTYWESPLYDAGGLFMSINGGAFRLLVPPAFEPAVAEMATGEYVIISRGNLLVPLLLVDCMEILFEDHTTAPYAIRIGPQQLDRLPIKTDEGRTDFRFLAYVRGEANPVIDLPARYRRVPVLPHLKKW